MKIQNIFAKPIDRDIKGVIKVGQDENENIKQELEEYVVTRELQKHFADFFANYKRGITGNTDEMGVWISGFFGSGKSHFLKILSYLLENKEVDGHTAIDYFIADNKIQDPMVLADMKLAAETPADVILFNVDSKGESTGKQDKDAILSVFLKAFNEMQGFCGAYPHVADLERRLAQEAKYEDFKNKFQEINGASWNDERYAIDFVQDDIVDSLSGIGFMSEDAARNWCEKATEPYQFSIERFAELVKKYIDEKGDNHHVVFLVDEIGQYIGDDSKLMLNLQTVTENLGTECRGKVWIIVTSQQDIDSITKTKGNDFSKIQGRFDTRLSLSSANADEVIRKRILEKNETGSETLSLLYDEKATVIKNLIVFNDGIEKKLYSDRENFAAVYPFIPYQFNLLGSVLTAIRTYGASGKHLADGERSLLALFKESAVRIMSREPGALVPFNMFYEPLEQFIDHSHRIVIEHANDNEHLNPNHEKDCFDVNVLKTLFMIKYVKEIKGTVDNITSLMVSDIDDDRMQLRQKVEDALRRLVAQTLVQRSGDTYVFLTNEEQEINRAIENQPCENAEITGKISQLIFDGLYGENKYKSPHLGGRYSYSFNQVVDDKPYKANQNHHLTLKILTPDSEQRADEGTMRMISGQEKCVLVVLPDDRAFIDEIRAEIQIEKFIRLDSTSNIAKYEQVKASKQIELREHKERAELYLKEALKSAEIYVNGDKLQVSSKEISTRINDAMEKRAQTVFNKLSYMDTAVSESDIRAVFKEDVQLKIDGTPETKNKLALDDVSEYIQRGTVSHTKTSMKSIMDRFTAPPYGFMEVDVQWLVAKLFKDGEISLYVNSEAVTLISKPEDEIIKYITRKEFSEKLMMEKRVKADERHKKAVREVMKELFRVTPSSDDDDAVMQSFIKYARDLKEELAKLEVYYSSRREYPGKGIVTEGNELIKEILQVKYPSEFFSEVYKKRDDFLDFADDYKPIKEFFEGEQAGIFDKTLNLIEIYDNSKTYIVDESIEKIVAEIKRIINMPSPFSEIYKLPGLNEEFTFAYSDILTERSNPVLAAIDEARKRVFDELAGKQCEKILSDKFVDSFSEIREKAEECNDVAKLESIKLEADALKTRCLNEINAEEKKIIEKKENSGAEASNNGAVNEYAAESTKPLKKQKLQKSVSIKSVNNEITWRLESEEDVKKYIGKLEKKLLEMLEEDTIINIEF